MKILNLPISTEINKSIPKNSFDKYTNTRQKRLFTDLIDKIRWLHKLSYETINLQGNDVSEIQVFEVQLKKKSDITELLNIIDRAVPYHIIFVVLFGNKFLFSASCKHPHPANEDNSVIDWTFQSFWLTSSNNNYQLNLKQRLDFVFNDFCKQLSGKKVSSLSIKELIKYEQQIQTLQKSIIGIEGSIKKQRQFNKKVELNLELQKIKSELETLEVKYIQ